MNRYSIEAENSRMRKIESTSTGALVEQPSRQNGDGGWFENNKRSILVLAAIALFALFLRVFFAFGLSAGNDFALSGGSSADYHVRVIVELITTGNFLFFDPSVNFPIGEVNTVPPLMDLIVAFFAWIATAFGVSATTAASGALALFTPIIGAITCIAVYFLGKELFNEKVGILAALFIAFFPLMITGSVLSNGTEASLYLLLSVAMTFYIVKAVKALTVSEASGFKAVFDDKKILKPVVIAGIFLALTALTWNGFYAVITMLIAIMVIQALIERFRSKDFTEISVLYSMVLLIGIGISALYYIPAGLWDAVFSGPFIVTLLAVGLTLAYAKFQSKPWTLVLPAMIVGIAAFLAVIFFAIPDLFYDIVTGNSMYENSIFGAIIGSSSAPSLSQLATYYGWATFWFPLIMFAYMIYKIRENLDSKMYMFTLIWIGSLICITWMSKEAMFIAAPIYAIASAVLIMWVFDRVAMKNYFETFKGCDFKTFWKKLLRPGPFMAVLVGVFLIAVPTGFYAIDASIPNNDKADYNINGFGASGYYIDTTKDSHINNLWDAYSTELKTGSLVSWVDYSASAVGKGGFTTVADPNGAGASAASNILLADGSEGATAAMFVRIVMTDIGAFESQIVKAGLDYAYIEKLIENEDFAIELVTSAPEVYGKVNLNISGENAAYLAIVEYITEELSEPKVDELYDSVCNSSNQINYIAVDGSMLPLFSGDGSYFTTMAYLNDYALQGGAPSEFFTYSTQAPYYCTYTDAMYDTLLWRALIGMAPADAGSSSGTNYLSQLALSDGTFKATPGYGLSNYSVAYWHVLYNEDDEATLSDEGWEDMDAYEAIKKQETDGGLINYIAGTVMLEYNSNNITNTISGKITYNDGTGTPAPAKGVQVAVFEGVDYNGDGIVDDYKQHATGYTDKEGRYEVSLSESDKKFRVQYSVATESMTGGRVVKVLDNPALKSPDLSFSIGSTSISGNVMVNDEDYITPADEPITIKIEGKITGYEATVKTTNSAYTFANVAPDIYTMTVVKADGTQIALSEYKTLPGANAGVDFEAASGKITVTATTNTGDKATSGTVVATNTTDGREYIATIDDGKATISVVPGTYTLSAKDGKASIYDREVSVTSGSSKTASLTVYDAVILNVTAPKAGSVVSVIGPEGFIMSSSTTAGTSAQFTLPLSVGASADNSYSFTIYSVTGNKAGESELYWATYAYTGSNTGSVTLANAGEVQEVVGVLQDYEGENADGIIEFHTADGKVMYANASNDKDTKGEFRVLLPEGKYMMYAHDDNDSVLYKNIEVKGSKLDLGNLETSEARKITSTVNYKTYMSSTTSKGLPYLNVEVSEIKVGEETYSISYMTNTSGKAIVYIPSGSSCKVTVGAIDNMYLTFEEKTNTIDSGTGNSSKSYTATAKEVKVSCDSGYTVFLDPYSGSLDEVTITSAGVSVKPGQYTATIKAESGYIYEGKVYIYPGTGSMVLDLDVKEVSTVTFDGLSASDKVEITEFGGSFEKDKEKANVWYLEDGFNYSVKVTDSDGKIVYKTINALVGDLTLDVKEKYEVKTVKGFAGVAGAGTLVVEYGSEKVSFPVKDGIFEAELPGIANTSMKFTAGVSFTADGKVDYFERSATISSSDIGKEDYTLNLSAVNSGVTATLGSASVDLDNKTVSFSITVNNKSNNAIVLIPEAGSAWSDLVFDQKTIVIAANGSYTLSVSNAMYDDGTKAGSSSLSVDFNDLEGNAVQSVVVDVPGMYLAYAESGVGSFVDGVANFAFTVKNNSDKAQSVYFTPGSAWKTLDFTNGESKASSVTLSPGQSATINATGTYDKKDYSAGNDRMTIVMKSALGDTIQTLKVDTSAMTAVDVGKTKVESSLGTDAAPDSINGFEYKYAVSVINEDNYSKFFTIDVKDLAAYEETMYVVFTNSSGSILTDADSAYKFEVKGYSTETVYVKFLPYKGEGQVPDIKLDVSVTSANGSAVEIETTSENVTVSGNTATLDLKKKVADMTVSEPNVDGDNVFLTSGPVPGIFWFLVVASVLLLFLVIWVGMRRGVFVRKN